MSDSTTGKMAEAPVSPRPRSNSQGELENDFKKVPAPLRHTKSWTHNQNGGEPLLSPRGPIKCKYLSNERWHVQTEVGNFAW